MSKKYKYKTRMIVGHKRIELPCFLPTIELSPRSWFWKYGIKHREALISYDTLIGSKKFLKKATRIGIVQALEFDRGLIVVDSGAYGKVIETNPYKIYQTQKEVKADVGILLDVIPHALGTSRDQWKSVKKTIENAANIKKKHHKKGFLLEGVIQGITKKQYQTCAKELKDLNLDIYGVGISHYLKRQKYERLLDKMLSIRSILPDSTIIHALGCGSRSFTAILSYFGISLFDSFTYFYYSIYRRKLRPVSLCATGKDKGTNKCRLCLSTVKISSTSDYFKYNLWEILKETIRVRCAIKHNTLRDYLDVRLKPKYKKAVKNYL